MRNSILLPYWTCGRCGKRWLEPNIPESCGCRAELVEHLRLDRGPFGFTLRWKADDYRAEFEVFAITGEAGQEVPIPTYDRRGAMSTPDPVESIEQAEIYLEGHVKWDGCSEIDMGQEHWCGPLEWKAHCALLEHVYKRAFELMQREPEESW